MIFCTLLLKRRVSNFPQFIEPTSRSHIQNKCVVELYMAATSKASIVIGGGSGFIGSVLSKILKQSGYDVLIVSRKPGVGRMSWQDLQSGLPSNCVAVVNVAGQNVLDPTRRWTAGFKQNVYASRVNTTRALADAISRMKTPPEVFACISGVGFYKPSETEEYTEESPGGDHDYLSDLCSQWEAASQLNDPKVRRVIVRSGVVLGRQGGMINQIFWPFYLGVGGPIANGKQFMPWIHVKDVADIFLHCIRTPGLRGVFNGVAPDVVTNGEFTRAFARALRRPAFLPLPEFFLNLAFSPERAVMMTRGQKVMPKRLLESGYSFSFPDIVSACEDCARVKHL